MQNVVTHSSPVPLDGGKVLLIVHALVAMALLGAATHLVIVAWRLWRGERTARRVRLLRIYSQVIGASFATAFLLGAILYPIYRVRVRAEYLDHVAPWATNLFDLKEHAAAIALALAVLLFFAGRRLVLPGDARLLPVLAGCAAGLWALILFATVAGLYVTSVRGV